MTQPPTDSWYPQEDGYPPQYHPPRFEASGYGPQAPYGGQPTYYQPNGPVGSRVPYQPNRPVGSPVPYDTSNWVPQPWGYQPPVPRKEPWLALLVSFFVPGVGTIMNGETSKGIGILIGYLGCLALSWLLLPIAGALGLWIWGMMDAYQGAQRHNLAHGLMP